MYTLKPAKASTPSFVMALYLASLPIQERSPHRSLGQLTRHLTAQPTE
jgi:hypothetical protein